MPISPTDPTQQLLANLHEAFAYQKVLRQHENQASPNLEIFESLQVHLNNIFTKIFNLLNKEIELDKVDKENKTVLFYAVLLEKPEVLEQLLAKGANPNMIVDHGKVCSPKRQATTAIKIAVVNDKAKSLIQLLKNISNFSELADKHDLLNLAAKWGSAEIVTILLEKGASPLLKDQNNNTPLHYALQAKCLSWLVNTKRFEMVRLLLDAGVPYATRNEDDNTILDLVLEKLNLVSEEIQQKDQIKILEVGKMLIELSLLENPFLPKPSLLENSPLEKFWEDCQKMASSFSQKISATTHSLGDFIKERNIEKLTAMCRNENIVSAAVELKITDCLEQFPYYAKHLKSGLENGLPRKLAIERGLIDIDTCKEITISKTIFENLTPYLPTKSIQAFHIAINPSVFFQIYKKPDSPSLTSEITYLPKPN